jgi:hypothetical protein
MRRQPSIDKSISSKPVVYCDACSEKHPTKQCWKVARALIIQRFIKKNLGNDILNGIEQAYESLLLEPMLLLQHSSRPTARIGVLQARTLLGILIGIG